MLTPSNVGSMNYNILRLLIEEYEVLQLNIGAEIGVLYADTSCYLLGSFSKLTMLCIDPYKEYVEKDGERTMEAMRSFEFFAHKRLEPFAERARFIRGTSLEVATDMRDECLDFVFIDANHEYESVRTDIEAWYPKVRPGGLFCGHDFRWEGVKRALVEFLERRDLQALVTPESSDIWYLLKPGQGKRQGLAVPRFERERALLVDKLNLDIKLEKDKTSK